MAPVFLQLAPQDILLHRLDADFYEPQFVQHARHVARKRTEKKLGMQTIGELGRLFTGPFGSKLPASLYREKGTPLFRVQNVYPFFPDESNIVFLDDDTHHELRASETLRGDVMIAKAGRVGDACLVPPHYTVANITEHVITLRPKAGIDPYYLVAAFNAPFVATQFQRFGLGTLLNYLGVTATRTVEVPIPEKGIARAIGNRVRKAERLSELATREQRRRSAEVDAAFGQRQEIETSQGGWVAGSMVEALRLDAWFNQPAYMRLADELSHRNLTPVSKLATLTAEAAKFEAATFDYYEISDMGTQVGLICAQRISAQGRPSRAKYAVRAGDILVSTVRPNRKGVAVVPDHVTSAVCSSGFSVLRAADSATAYFVHACLLHDLATQQLMRWNTGAVYPAIDRRVPEKVLIPRFDKERIQDIGTALHQAAQSLNLAAELIAQAISAVESLIGGSLEEDHLLAESAEIEAWLQNNPSPALPDCTAHPRDR